MQSSNPKPQVIWGCVCQAHILVLWKGFLHLPWSSRTGVTRLSSSHTSNPHTQDKEPQSNRTPISRRWTSPSPPFGEDLLTSTLHIWKAHWIHCSGADWPRTLPTQPHSYTQTSHSSKYRSPSSIATACTKKALNKGRQPSRTFAECLCIIYSCYHTYWLKACFLE